MTRDELIAICERWSACEESIDWLDSLTCETAAECWDACERGNWMVWLLTARNGIVPDRVLRLIAVDYARAVQPIADAWFAQHAPHHVGVCVRLLDLIESDPDADPQTWAAARDAAWDAARDAASVSAMSAARSAAWAASDDASVAACDASWAAREAASADQARIVRARVSWDNVEAGLRGVA